jgi:UDP-glucose 4-epimerase
MHHEPERSSQSLGHVLVTGGAGYIGSTVCSALLDAGWTPIILDNLSQGRLEFTKGRIFYAGDIADRALIAKIVKERGPLYGVIHCAALIVVPESVEKPEEYYRENVAKSVELFAALRDSGCKRIVFSSSAAIYDTVEGFMVNETSPLRPLSPYSRTKFMMEMVLQDFCQAYGLRGVALRYFNPIGADPKMRSGAYVKSPTHVLGRLVSVALGKASNFEITGTSWPTRDGSGIRDYIHVWDLARAHVQAITHFDRMFADQLDGQVAVTNSQYKVINLGTGRGVTVRELVSAFEQVYGKALEKRETSPRQGDVAGSFASCEQAAKLMSWRAELSVEDGIRDALAWTKKWAEILGSSTVL